MLRKLVALPTVPLSLMLVYFKFYVVKIASQFGGVAAILFILVFFYMFVAGFCLALTLAAFQAEYESKTTRVVVGLGALLALIIGLFLIGSEPLVACTYLAMAGFGFCSISMSISAEGNWQ